MVLLNLRAVRSVRILVIGLMASLLQVSVGFAEECGGSSAATEVAQRLEVDLKMIEQNQADIEGMLLLCGDSRLNLRSVRPGFRCLTQSRHIFVRVHQPDFGEAWKSEQGLIWSSLRGTGTHQQAAELCRKLGGRLPRVNEAKREIGMGLTEVVKDLLPQSPSEVRRIIRTFELQGGRSEYGSPMSFTIQSYSGGSQTWIQTEPARDSHIGVICVKESS